jgi:glucose dehydrogenase
MSTRHLNERKYLFGISTLFIAAILAFSAAMVNPIRAAASSNGGDWTGENGPYPYNWDFSNQTQITPQNAANLQLKWIFPMPAPPANCIRCGGLVLTPIVVGGIAYGITDSQYIFALNAATGGVLWTKQLPIPTYGGIVSYSNYAAKGPYPASPGIQGHYHSFWYTTQVRGQPLIWIAANNYTVYAFNANTGTQVLKFNLINPNDKVPGNFGLYVSIVPQMVIDQKNGIAVFGVDVSEGTTAGRGFFAGYDVTTDPPKQLWTQFVIPPQDGSDPNWGINSVKGMDYAYTFDGAKQIDLKALPSDQLTTMLQGDWGKFNFDGTRSYAGAGAGWGGDYAYDPATGTAYVATSQASPDWNATFRPGPNLWSDSLLAINMKTGHIIWAFQTTAHDLWDWDCAWSTMFAHKGSQAVVMKGCKNGYFYKVDANTGKLLGVLNPSAIKRLPTTVLLNPLSATDMKKPWENYPSTGPYIQNPPGTGGIESDPAYDPQTNMSFFATYNAPNNQQTHAVGAESPWGASGQTAVPGYVRHYNTTIYALDANTWQTKWTYFIDNVGFRGGITASNGMLFVPSIDGHIYELSETDGSVIGKFFTGSAMVTQPAFAADVNGKTTLFIPGSGAPAYSFTTGINTVPGYLAAFSAPTAAAGGVTTVTQTAAGAPSGIDPTLFYSVTAIAVVAIIVAGVALATRRRPAF